MRASPENMTHMADIPLAAKPIDRAAHYRLDAAWQRAALTSPETLFFLMREGEPLMNAAGGLVWLGPHALKLSPIEGPLFLGVDKTGTPIFALDMSARFQLEGAPIDGLGEFVDARHAFGALRALEANLASTARSLFEWHRHHGFCARCGAKSVSVEAGWKRQCEACRGEHFPRTDPVAIMLAVKGDRCLLGRQASWPKGFYSCLAGFVEPGETVEQAAARELEEEAGIQADWQSARYLFGQPWPFPSSLMVGVILQAETEEITIDAKEIEEAKWFSRSEVQSILEGQHPVIYAPPEMAIAHHIMKVWAYEDPGSEA